MLTDLDKSEGIALFTDGSAWNKDGSGGWAWIAMDTSGHEAEGTGGVHDTTNNRMEMVAWIEGLKALAKALGPCHIIVISDSEYVGLGSMDRTRGRKHNTDLWPLLDAAIDTHLYVEFAHVKGHSNHVYNDRVDKLAGEARMAFKKDRRTHKRVSDWDDKLRHDTRIT